MNDILNEMDQAFFNDGYNFAKRNLESGINRLSVIKMTRDVYEYIDGFIDEFLKNCHTENKQVDCKKGCAHCCHQSVFVLPHEAVYLYRFIKLTSETDAFESFKENVLKKDAVTAKYSLKEILNYNKPCPFLEKNICSVYEVRPMACRLFQSMNVQSCIVERENPLDSKKIARLYDLPLRAGRMLNEGICAYFTEKGMKTTEWIMESSLSLLFQSDNVAEKWMNGEEIFKRRELSEAEWELLRKYDRSN